MTPNFDNSFAFYLTPHNTHSFKRLLLLQHVIETIDRYLDVQLADLDRSTCNALSLIRLSAHTEDQEFFSHPYVLQHCSLLPLLRSIRKLHGSRVRFLARHARLVSTIEQVD